MTVVDTKIWASWPFFGVNVCSWLWRKKVCYYWNSIFIIISYKPLVSIGCICSHNPCSFVWCLCCIIIRNYDFMCWLDCLTLILCVSWVINCFQSIAHRTSFTTWSMAYCLFLWLLLPTNMWSRRSFTYSTIIWL